MMKKIMLLLLLFAFTTQANAQLFPRKNKEDKEENEKKEKRERKPLFGKEKEERKPLFGREKEKDERKPLFGKDKDEKERKPLFGRDTDKKERKPLLGDFKIYQRSYGMILGYQRGRYDFFELGVEQNWRKMKLVKPRIFALSANVEYNPFQNALGFRAGAWTKTGRINFTYGLNGGYFTNFYHSRPGLGPAVGFRILGFHGQAGYTHIFNRPENFAANSFYVSLRFFLLLRTKVDMEKNGKKKRLFKLR